MEGHQDSLGDLEWGAGRGNRKCAMIRDVEDVCHVKLIGAKLVLANFTNVNANKLLHVVSPVVRQV